MGASALGILGFGHQMSDFVNYNKRSVALPPGCKDLIDLLRSQARKTDTGGPLMSPRRGESVGTMAHLEKYAQMLFESDAKFFLSITSEDGEVLIRAIRYEDVWLEAGVCVQEATELERTLRTFFIDHGLALPQGPPLAFDWIPNAPVYRTYDFSPAPRDADAFVALVTDVFQQVAGLKAESRLCFQYVEIA
jgi:hypothetical protein